MSWSLDSQSPIYLQLAHRIRMQIIGGQYVPGDRLPGVRAVAQEYAQRMQQFGLNREQAAELVRRTSQEGENETWNAYSNAGD